MCKQSGVPHSDVNVFFQMACVWINQMGCRKEKIAEVRNDFGVLSGLNNPMPHEIQGSWNETSIGSCK